MKVEENYIGDLTESENRKYREPTGTYIELIPLYDKSAVFFFFDNKNYSSLSNEKMT